jgi:hypothetical protein
MGRFKMIDQDVRGARFESGNSTTNYLSVVRTVDQIPARRAHNSGSRISQLYVNKTN